MANILFFSHLIGFDILSGADKVLLNIAAHQQRVGNQPLVVFSADCYAARYFAKCGLRVEVLPYNYFWDSMVPGDDIYPRFLEWVNGNQVPVKLLMEFMSRAKADLVHINTLINPSGAVAAKSLGIPVLWHLHELFQGGTQAGRKVVSEMVAYYADRVVCVSSAVLKDFTNFTDPAKFRVIHNGVDPVDSAAKSHPRIRLGWRKSFGIPETAPVAAFLGTIMHHKGVYEFIQIAREVANAIPEAKFVICGNQHLDQGYTDFLEQAVGNLGLEGKVIFTGYYEDIGKFLPGIDLLVVPSINREPFGMVIIEAMAHCKPVVAFNSGGISDIILQGKTGFLVSQGDCRELAARVIQVFSNPVKAQSMGKQGGARVREMFTLELQMRRLAEEYAGLLAKR